jgi:hypothetical protein
MHRLSRSQRAHFWSNNTHTLEALTAAFHCKRTRTTSHCRVSTHFLESFTDHRSPGTFEKHRRRQVMLIRRRVLRNAPLDGLRGLRRTLEYLPRTTTCLPLRPARYATEVSDLSLELPIRQCLDRCPAR